MSTQRTSRTEEEKEEVRNETSSAAFSSDTRHTHPSGSGSSSCSSTGNSKKQYDATVLLDRVKNWSEEGVEDRETAFDVAKIKSQENTENEKRGGNEANEDKKVGGAESRIGHCFDKVDKDGIVDDKSYFSIRPSFNKIVRVFRGDVSNLEVDAVVNPTSSNLRALTPIMRRGGKSLLREATLKSQDEPDMTTGDTVITRVYNDAAPFRYVLHTIAPRWREDFAEAAEHALFSCYRSCLVQAKQNRDIRTIAFPVLSHHFPPKDAAFIAARTLRKFLDRFVMVDRCAAEEENGTVGGTDEAENTDVVSDDRVSLCAIIFVVKKGDSHRDAFAVELRRALRLFFPRTKAETAMQSSNFVRREKADYDSNGARVLRERSIRITGTFAPLKKTSSLSKAAASKWRRSRKDGVPMPGSGGRRKNSRGSPTPARGDEGGAGGDKRRASSREDVDPMREYKTDIVPLNWMYTSGEDSRRRPIVVVNGAHLPVASIREGGVDMERAIKYALRIVAQVASRPYVVVYTHSGFDDDRNMPSMDWMHRLHMNLPREHRKLLQKIYVLHGNVWLRMRFWFQVRLYMNVSSKVWQKVEFVDSVPALRSAFEADQLILPSDVHRYDRVVNPNLYARRSRNSSSDAPI